MLLDSNYEKVWVPTRYSSCISNIKLTGGTKKALGVKTDNCVKKVGVEGGGWIQVFWNPQDFLKIFLHFSSQDLFIVFHYISIINILLTTPGLAGEGGVKITPGVHLPWVQRETLISTIIPVLNSKNQNLSSLDNEAKVKLLLYGTENLDFSGNKWVLNATINFIRLTERFDQERTFAST